MPKQNRVTPYGEIEAFPLRGAFTGNRGILHEGKRIVRFHAPGAFVEVEGAPFLVLGAELVEWTREGYGSRRRHPRTGTARAITPPATLAVLRAGYPVQIDAGAGRPGR